MTLYIGVDIHARQQTLSYLDTSDGTTAVVELSHARDEVREYYSQFQGEVIVGIEDCRCTNRRRFYRLTVEGKTVLQARSS